VSRLNEEVEQCGARAVELWRGVKGYERMVWGEVNLPGRTERVKTSEAKGVRLKGRVTCFTQHVSHKKVKEGAEKPIRPLALQ
jgi:hypothetical protein